MRTSKSAEGRGISVIPQPLCQSGIWRSPVADGVYTSLGSFKGTYNGSNTTGKTMK
ncbi:prepilin, shufflon protein A, partial [Escherichia coli]|nr:prepilin, shufflon protein A [Escherichia coli]